VRHLSRWWGPDGFSTSTSAFEFREGGAWEFVMHHAELGDFPNWITRTEIATPARIALAHGTHQDDPDAFTSVFTFEPVGDQTEVVLRTVFPTKADRDEAVARVGAIEGGKQTLAHLADYVAAQAGA
jgi:uncharacterized protein YndB with AHSA1/START domain